MPPNPQRSTSHPQRSPEGAGAGLFRTSPVPMLLADARSRRVVRANAALGRLVGRDPVSLEGAPVRDFEHQGDGGGLEEHLVLAVACRDDAPRVRRWRGPDGSEILVEVRAVRLHEDQGTLVVLHVRDLTRETELAQREKASARTGLLLDRRHQAIGRLASGLARELDALLDGVDRLAVAQDGAGLDEPPPPGVRALLDKARAARTLVREFLAFTGQEEPEARRVRLGRVVEEAAEELRGTLPQDIGLLVRPCPHPALVDADPDHIREILGRLVDRARRVMDDGGYVVVAVEEVEVDAAFASAHPSVRPGPHAVLSVTDSGPSMDEEAQNRIFEPFFSSQELGQGSGLGLATVYGLVKRNGGTIWVTSRPGVGTAFRVYLPRVDEGERRDRARIAPGAAPA